MLTRTKLCATRLHDQNPNDESIQFSIYDMIIKTMKSRFTRNNYDRFTIAPETAHMLTVRDAVQLTHRTYCSPRVNYTRVRSGFTRAPCTLEITAS